MLTDKQARACVGLSVYTKFCTPSVFEVTPVLHELVRGFEVKDDTTARLFQTGNPFGLTVLKRGGQKSARALGLDEQAHLSGLGRCAWRRGDFAEHQL